MKKLFHPRDFSYIDMPEDWQDIDFDNSYCEWLLDYLLKVDKAVPACQKETWKDLSGKDPIAAARILGENALLHNLYYVEPFDNEGNLPESYDAVYKVLLEEHLESMKGLDGDAYEPIEMWISPEIWSNAEREYKEYGTVASDAPDVGYRIILSKLIKLTDDKEKQLAVLHEFYQAYLEK